MVGDETDKKGMTKHTTSRNTTIFHSKAQPINSGGTVGNLCTVVDGMEKDARKSPVRYRDLKRKKYP